MYLSWDSQLYTSSGWMTMEELRVEGDKLREDGYNHDLLLACCDIIGRVYWTLARIEVMVHHVRSNNKNDKYEYSVLKEGELELIANGLINSGSSGWVVPEKGTSGVWISFNSNGFEKDNVDLPIASRKPLSEFSHDNTNTRDRSRSVADVIGLPIGIIIDSMSVYPSNINSAKSYPQANTTHDFIRKIIYPFVPISDDLIEEEMSMISGTTDLIEYDLTSEYSEESEEESEEMEEEESEENSELYDNDL